MNWRRCSRWQAVAWGGSRIVHKIAGLVGIQPSGLTLQGMTLGYIEARRRHYGIVVAVGECVDDLTCRV